MAEEPGGGTPIERLGMVRDHIRFENAHDLAAVLATFGPSATYDDEPWDEHDMGRDAVRSFYEDLLRGFKVDAGAPHQIQAWRMAGGRCGP